MLKKLTIHKFRSCEETTVDLDQPLSALCGKNGVGKTTILRAIEWVAREVVPPDRPRSVWTLRVLSDEPLWVKVDLSLSGNSYTYSIKLLPSEFEPEILIENFSIHDEDGNPMLLFERDNDTIKIPATNRTLRTGGSTPSPAVLLALLPDDDPLLAQVRSLVSFFRGVRYYPLNDSEEDRIFITERNYNDWKIRYENEGATSDSVNLRLIHLWNEHRPVFEEILHLVGPEGMGLIEDFEVVKPAPPAPSAAPTRELPPEAKYFVPLYKVADSMGGAGKTLAFHELSEGTRRVIRLVTSLIFDDRSLMMLEQPEDAIHPGLLHKVIDLLKTYSDRTQVLMATHSPTVLDALDPENIMLVTAPRGVTQVRRLSAEDLEHARLFLQDEGSLSEFLGPMVDELSLEGAG